MTQDTIIGWRSLLFVPATNERFIASALRTDADAIQLDLEDSIGTDDKDLARQVIGGAVARIATEDRDVVVRVNRPLRQLVRDLEAAVQPGLTAITLPKVDESGLVDEVADVITELEAERGMPHGGVGLIAMIETAKGLTNAPAIARSSARLVALTIGPEDLAVSLGCAVTEDAMYQPAMTVLTAARAAGKLPLGYVGSISEYTDLDKYRHWIERARGLGFEGAFCVHPTQVPILNEAFMTSAEELVYARALVAAFEQQAGDGKAAFAFDGKMIDAPVALRARQVIRRAQRTNK